MEAQRLESYSFEGFVPENGSQVLEDASEPHKVHTDGWKPQFGETPTR